MAKARRGLRPRAAVKYDNEQHATSGGSAPPDDHTISERAPQPVSLFRPRYNDGEMVVRPWPALAYEDPSQLVCGRKSAAPNGHSHWIVRVPAARYVGTGDGDNFTFLLCYPWERKEKLNNNPYSVLYRACKRAHDEAEFSAGGAWDARWNRLMKGGKGKGAAIAPPTALFFMQGSVYVNGDRDYVSDRDSGLPIGEEESDSTPVIQLPVSAGIAMFDLLAREKEQWEGDEQENPSLPFMYGDPTGIPVGDKVRGGLFLILFNPNKTKSYLEHSSYDGPKVNQGYEVAVRSKFKTAGGVVPASLDEQQVAVVRDKWMFWFDDPETDQPGILRIPSIEEQCVMIAKGYKSVPDLVRYSWGDHPEFLTAEVQGILNNRRAAVVDGLADEVPDFDDDAADAAPPPRRSARTAQTDAAVMGPATDGGGDEFDFDGESEQAKPQPKPKPKVKSQPEPEPVDDFDVDDFDVDEGEGEEIEATAGDDPADAVDDASTDPEFDDAEMLAQDEEPALSKTEAAMKQTLAAARARGSKRASPPPVEADDEFGDDDAAF